jgi:hypothetical protein
MLHEAIAAYLSLTQTYFESAGRRASPDFGFKIAKRCLDVLRYEKAAREQYPIAQERPQHLTTLRGELSADLFALLQRPEHLRREDALGALHLAMLRLHRTCNLMLESNTDSPVSLSPHPHQSALYPGNADAILWEKRTMSLRQACPLSTGLHIDTLFRWYVAAEQPPDSASLDALARKMDHWHLTDNAFQAPGWLVTYAILQGMVAGPHLHAPCLWRSFNLATPRESGPLRALAYSRFPLWNHHYRLQWNFQSRQVHPPAEPQLRRAARQAAAELSLALRPFGLSSENGTPSYRLFYLYSRILSLRIFLEKSIQADPQDIDSLFAIYQAEYPESRPWLKRLETEWLCLNEEELNRLPPDAVFYPHLAFLQQALSKLLGALT